MSTEKITYDSQREVVSDLFCADNDKVNRALHFICTNPAPDYSKALCHLEKQAGTIPRKILCLKALCLCDPPTARKHLSAILKHQNPRLRAGGISLIPLLNPDLDNSGLLAYLLQSLSDKDKKVAAATLDALRKCIPKEKFSAILQNYFDPENEKSCFNSLFIMYKLETEFQPYIFESCLNHNSHKIQTLARRLLPHFKKQHPELEKLLLRKNSQKSQSKALPPEPATKNTLLENEKHEENTGNGSSPFHEILEEILKSDDNRDKITILMEIRENESWFKDPFIYRTLQKHFQYESEPFVLATLVKTYARLANHENSEWQILQKYLEHEDKRVVANTVEAIAHLKEKPVIPWLQAFITGNDLSDKSNCRIISAGMDFLREESPDTAIAAMKRLAQSGQPGISAFIHHISQWENPPVELEKSVMELIACETRSQDLYPLINHIARYGSLKSAALTRQIRQKLPSGEKAELLDELLKRLYERFDQEDINSTPLSKQDMELTVHSDLTEKLSTDIGLKKEELPPKSSTITTEEDEKSISIFEDWRIILLLFLTLLVFIFIIFFIYSSGKNQLIDPSQSNPTSENYSTEIAGPGIKNNPEIPEKILLPEENIKPVEARQSATENSEIQVIPTTTENSEAQTTSQSTPEINMEKPEETKEPETKTTPEKSAPVDFPRPPPVRTHHIAL